MMDFKDLPGGSRPLSSELAGSEGLAEDLVFLFVELGVLVLGLLSVFSLFIAVV